MQAHKLANTQTVLETGTVERILSGTVEVRLPFPAGVHRGRVAKSCLVVPEAGDTVLCTSGPAGTFVLAVLEGAVGAPTRIGSAGDLHIESQGRVVVSAAEGVDLMSGGKLAMTAGELQVRAPKGSVAVEELGFFGRVVQAQVAKVALIADDVDTIVERIAQRAKRVFRFVEELDQTRAGAVDLRAHHLVAIRGENAVVSARVLAKLDGEQIHLG
jgi:hypothetical protein